MTRRSGSRATNPGSRRSTAITAHSLHNLEKAGQSLTQALDNGYRPWMSTAPYETPKAGTCRVGRTAWITQAVYALVPDLLVHTLTADFDQLALTDQPPPHAARAVAAALTNCDSALRVPVAAAWTHAVELLTARDQRIRLGLHLARLGNPYPLASRYNEMQPYTRLDLDPEAPNRLKGTKG
jgi:hypothetical protein